MIGWINRKFNLQLDAADLESIKDLSLMWNIFERDVCNSRCTVANIAQALENTRFNLADFESDYTYYRNRYIVEADGGDRFDNLHFRPNDRKDFVRQVLAAGNSADANLVPALAIIVFRLRNNLFHSLKEIRLIDRQKDNFDHANHFLMRLLDYF